MIKKNEPWYTARCLFSHKDIPGCKKYVYEERVLLIKADNEDQAFEKALADAKKYASADPNVEFTGQVDLFHLYDEKLEDGTEVYSVMNESPMEKFDYIKRFYLRGKYVGKEAN